MANYIIDVDHSMFDLDHTPPGTLVEVEDLIPDHAHDMHIPDPPPGVTRAYHPRLNGKSLNITFLCTYSNIGHVL